MVLIHQDLSYQILGAMFDVYNEIGSGHKEAVYQKAIALAFEKRQVPFESQVKTDLSFFGEPVGLYYLDFLVDKKVILESNHEIIFVKQISTKQKHIWRQQSVNCASWLLLRIAV